MIVLWMWFALAFGQERVDDNHVPVEVIAEVSEPSPEPLLPPTSVDVETVPSSVIAEGTRAVLPWFPLRGFWVGVLLSLLALSCVGLVAVTRALRRRLASTGLLPATLELGEMVLRVLTLFFGFGVFSAWIPAHLAPLLPWVLVFGAAALGWSLRDLAPDFMAWVALALEGRIRVGTWVEVGGSSGRVASIGLRSTVLRDWAGREISMPNRHLIREPVTGDVSPWPSVEVELNLGASWDTSEARWALREATLLSPWIAPEGEPEIRGNTLGEGRWRVRVRLLDGRYVSAFQATLRERAHQILMDRKTTLSDEGSTPPP